MFFVFDLDGTLADVAHRRHFVRGAKKDFRSFYRSCVTDTAIEPVVATLKAHVTAGHRVEIWSGRSDEVRGETLDWLEDHGIDPALLTNMRPASDYQPDDTLKRQWLLS